MIYNKIQHLLYNNISDAINLTGLTKDMILDNIKYGYWLHFKKDKLLYYYNDGKIDISKEQLFKYTDNWVNIMTKQIKI